MSEKGMAAGCVPARAGTVRAKASAGSSQLKLCHESLVELGFEFTTDSFLYAADGFGERSGAKGGMGGAWRMQNSCGRFGTPSTSVRKPAIQPPIGADAFIK